MSCLKAALKFLYEWTVQFLSVIPQPLDFIMLTRFVLVKKNKKGLKELLKPRLKL